MGYEAKRTEHCGPKRRSGAYWGYKWGPRKSPTASAPRTGNARSAPRSAIATPTGNGLQQPARGDVSLPFSAAESGFRELLVIRGYQTVTCCPRLACAILRASRSPQGYTRRQPVDSTSAISQLIPANLLIRRGYSV